MLTVVSILLSLAIVGFGFFQGRRLFGAQDATAGQLDRLAGMLDTCHEGISFKEVLPGWLKHEDPAVRGIAKTLFRLFDKPPMVLHGTRGWVVDLEALCDAENGVRNHPATARIEAMPGLLMGTGILFTFLGLAVGVFGLDPTNAQEMTSGVKRLLGGMSLAFLTSIAGIGTGLWWTWFQKGVVARLAQGYAALSDVLHDKAFLLIPDEMSYQMLEYQAATAKGLDDLEGKLTRAAARALEESGVKDSLEALGGAENEKRMIVILNAIRNEMANMGSLFARTGEIQEQIGSRLGKLLDQGNALATTTEPGDPQQQAKLIAHTRKVLTDFGQVHAGQGEAVQAIKDTATEVRKLMEGARIATGDIIKNHRALLEHVQRLEKHWESYQGHLQRMQKTLDDTLMSFKSELEGALGKAHEEMDSLMAQGLTHFSGAIQEMQDTLEALSTLIREEPAKRKGLLGKRG